MAMSQASISHGDVIDSIKNILGSGEVYKKLSEIDENEQRIRYFYFTEEPNGDIFDKYEIKGNVRERENAKYLYSVGQ